MAPAACYGGGRQTCPSACGGGLSEVVSPRPEPDAAARRALRGVLGSPSGWL